MPRKSTTQAKRTWGPAPEALVSAFEAALPTLPGARPRKMFGYPAMFVNGKMFAGIARDKIVLRLAEADHRRFLRLPGAKPFVAMGGRVMKQWVVVPRTMTHRPAELCRWLRRALSHGRSLQPKPRKTTGKRAHAVTAT
jgi:TfoX/Sxy family transcriptional regulator of competence genes